MVPGVLLTFVAAQALLAPMSAAEKAETQRVVNGLQWASKRMGCVTDDLRLRFEIMEDIQDKATTEAFLSAFDYSKAERLKLLKVTVECLEVYGPGLEGAKEAIAKFAQRLLERAQAVEVLSFRGLRVECLHSIPCFNQSQLVHLMLDLFQFGDATLLKGWELPALETLQLRGYWDTGHGNALDASHLRNLRMLNLRGGLPHDLILPPLCRFSFKSSGEIMHEFWEGKIRPALCLAESVEFELREEMAESSDNLFDSLRGMRELKVFWYDIVPDPDIYIVSDEVQFLLHTEARNRLINSMPVNGQPLLNLRSIDIDAPGAAMIYIPRKLPSLEQLRIGSDGYLEVQFQNPQETASALISFHALGFPLKLDAVAILKMSQRLAVRGLTLDVAFDARGQSSVYIRHIDAEQRSMQQIKWQWWDGRARVFACRCGACFDCLIRAGRVAR